MTDTNTKTARLARQWAEALDPEHLNEETRAVHEHIMATTTPQTMADVEWEDEKHYLAGAVDADGHEVAMLAKLDENIRVCYIDQMGLAYPVLESPKTLTPNGKRYELQDMTDEPENPDEPEHPATLETQADYENAPKGTIVARGDSAPYVKLRRGYWENPRYIPRTDASMANTLCKVIRWGWDE